MTHKVNFSYTPITKKQLLITNLEMAGDIGLNVGDSLEKAFGEALKKHGENARIAFVPYGRYTIFDR